MLLFTKVAVIFWNFGDLNIVLNVLKTSIRISLQIWLFEATVLYLIDQATWFRVFLRVLLKFFLVNICIQRIGICSQIIELWNLKVDRLAREVLDNQQYMHLSHSKKTAQTRIAKGEVNG